MEKCENAIFAQTYSLTADSIKLLTADSFLAHSGSVDPISVDSVSREIVSTDSVSAYSVSSDSV